jgi:hypothetical protein
VEAQSEVVSGVAVAGFGRLGSVRLGLRLCLDDQQLQTRMSLYQLPNHDKKQQNPVCMGSLSSIRPQSESLSNRFFSGFRVLELRILAAPDRYYPPPVGGKNRVHASKDSMGIELEPFYYSIEG